jgi:hypothetical protein
MPRGFSKPNTVLRLNKSLYGLKQSSLNWFNLIKSRLEACGLKQQLDVDPCLFIGKKVICLVYVDDTLFFAKSLSDINEVLVKLREMNLTMQQEEDVAGFLGVHIR